MSEQVRVLLTNDDGIRAPGLRAIEKEFRKFDNIDLWVVAPDRERSACSHGMSLARPVYTKRLDSQKISVDGLPVDCVYLGCYGLLPKLPHVVFSGINRGPNLGTDVITSGTVAGARQAALQGIHALAVSIVEGDDFEPVAKSAAQITIDLAKLPPEQPVLLNLNYPGGKFRGPQFARLGTRNYPRVVSRRTAPLTGQTYYWLGGSPAEKQQVGETDGWLIEQGIASATWLNLDQTNVALMENSPLALTSSERRRSQK